MRTYYLFQIKSKYKKLTISEPDKLYKAIEGIYHLRHIDYIAGEKLLNDLRLPIPKDKLNKQIYNYLQNNTSYTCFKNSHYIHNYFTQEESILTIKNNYLIIESTKEIPTFFQIFSPKSNLFVCDFSKKDYFFLESLS